MVEQPRKKLRLKDYDYSQEGAYFLTICVQNRLPLFADKNVSTIIDKWIQKIPDKYPEILLDYYVVMKDHVHIILIFNKGNREKLQEIMKWFKTMTTNEYIRGVKDGIYIPYEKKLWQRSYYDHIIRNDEDLNEKRQYIIDNPLKKLAKEHPDM